jgi:serine/threonine-protein kinase RsbW
MGGRSTPLGVTIAGQPRGEAEIVLPPGAALLLYTDGLVERRGEAIDTALERLVAAVAEHAGTPRERLNDRLAAELLLDDAGDDDVCLLLFSLSPPRA